MKKLALAIAAAGALALSTSAMAETYVSGAIGKGHINVDCTDTTSCSNNGTAFKLTAGYGFGNGWSAELGYISFGKADLANGADSASVKATAFTLGAAYWAALSPEWKLGVRLGVADVKTELSATLVDLGSFSESATKVKPYFGLGAGYAVAKNVNIEAGLDFSKAEYDSTLSGNVRALTVGVRFAF